LYGAPAGDTDIEDEEASSSSIEEVVLVLVDVFVLVDIVALLVLVDVFVLVDVVALTATHFPLMSDPIDDTTSTSIPFEALHSQCDQPQVYPMLTQNSEIAGRHVFVYSLVRAIQPAHCVKQAVAACTGWRRRCR
jgi:hypothetical protein